MRVQIYTGRKRSPGHPALALPWAESRSLPGRDPWMANRLGNAPHSSRMPRAPRLLAHRSPSAQLAPRLNQGTLLGPPRPTPSPGDPAWPAGFTSPALAGARHVAPLN